jgi:hypothetical protein
MIRRRSQIRRVPFINSWTRANSQRPYSAYSVSTRLTSARDDPRVMVSSRYSYSPLCCGRSPTSGATGRGVEDVIVPNVTMNRYGRAMTTAPRDALDRLVAALQAHLDAVTRRSGEADPAVAAAYQTLADAFETYDDALYDTYDEVTPFVLVEEGDDDEDDDDLDEDDLDEDDEDDLDEDYDDLDEELDPEEIAANGVDPAMTDRDGRPSGQKRSG